MAMKTQAVWKHLWERYASLECCKEQILDGFALLCRCYRQNGKLMVCGNGGSAADSEHIVGELMKSFSLPRKLAKTERDMLEKAFPGEGAGMADALQYGLPAISLPSQVAVLSAFNNDIDPSLAFAQMVFGYKAKGDVVLGISTSGSSENIIKALQVAKTFGLATIGLTGAGGGKMASLCDVTIRVPETETYKIQELHLPVYHALCLALEAEFFEGGEGL